MRTLSILLAVVIPGGISSAVDFNHEIIPLLTKFGCNSGACHGAAVGRGGFKLSLYGGDADKDFRSIVRELEGRRVNQARPDESLIVMKATESVEHGGGCRFDPGSAAANRLINWIEAGTPRRESETARSRQLEHLEISPATHVANRPGETLSLAAHAHFSDDSTRDVTRWTVFSAEDPFAVSIDPVSAEAAVLRRGRHIVIGRFLSQVVPVEILLPMSDEPVDLTNQRRENFIDDRVLDVLESLRIGVSPPADDSTFLRRVTLDLIGRLPTREGLHRFLSDNSRHKRTRYVDGLLESDEFNEYWTLRLAKLFRVRPQGPDKQGALAYHRWLRGQLGERVGFDRIARKLLTATGDTHIHGPANFYRTVAGPRAQAELASELFMGCRLRCANCHNHPLDRWTMDDYHGLAAVFATVQSGRVVRSNTSGVVVHPGTGANALPRIPGSRFLESESDAPAVLADWLTDRDNPYLAKAMVNRLWKAVMGRGLVEPTDDMRATNPASHPELLDQLASDFIDHGFDLRHTLKRIAASTTYGRASQVTTENRDDDRYYSHAFAKPLSSEVLLDAISDVLEVPEPYAEEPLGTRAVSLFDPTIRSESLDVLGRCSRQTSCETAAGSSAGLPRMLHMLNGPLLNRRISEPTGRLYRLIEEGKRPMPIIAEFYEVALGREPSEQEQAFWRGQVQRVALNQQSELLEDFVWSLLSCEEFVTNH